MAYVKYLKTVYGASNPQEQSQEKEGPKIISLSNPEFSDRSERLDLITNNLVNIETKINGTASHLCDISQSGFSYAKIIGIKKNTNYDKAKETIIKAISNTYGAKVESSFCFKDKPDIETLNIICTIRNHFMFKNLSLKEIKLELKNFLYMKNIKRNRDRLGMYEKVDYLMERVHETVDKNHWNEALAVSLNTTLLNLMIEVGTTGDYIDDLYRKYNNHNMYVRFGASIDDPKQAKALNVFIQRDSREKTPSDSNGLEQREIIQLVRKQYTYRSFLIKVWKNCLYEYGIDPSSPIPKSNNKTLAIHLKKEAGIYNNALECLRNDIYKPDKCQAVRCFLTNGIYRVMDMTKREQIDKKDIVNKIQNVVISTYQQCQEEVGTSA